MNKETASSFHTSALPPRLQDGVGGIKLLSPDFANDEERLRRVEWGAKAASALKYPKSCMENILLNQNPKLTRVMSIALWLALVICPGKIVNSQDNASSPDPIPKTDKDGPSLKFDRISELKK
jgi:hypothetical protein